MIKRRICFFCFLLLLFFFSVVLSFSSEKSGSKQPGVLKDIVLSRGQNIIEVKIILNPYSYHRLFELRYPNRVVIDLFDIEDIQTSRYIEVNDREIQAIRTGMFKTDIARVVFDLKEQIPLYKIERIQGGLKVMFWKKEIQPRVVLEKENSDRLEKQITEIKESIEKINEKLEDIKKILKEALHTQDQLKIQPSNQKNQAIIQREQRPSLDHFSIEERIAQAAILSQGSIEIDGKLDEFTWEEASVLTDFTQHEPIEGTPATERTEVKVFFSEDSVYIGVRAFDSNPEKIKAILARRDSKCPSDWIRIYVDSYHDHLTAFEFAVNPCGVKRDVYWSNDHRQDDDWDGVWDVEVSQDEQGWIAEFRIPYSQIRFPEKEFQTWGFQASRVIARRNETSYWRHVPKGVPRFVSLFGDLKGITGIPAPKRLQFLPYTVGRSSFQPKEEGNPFQTGSSYLANLGLDLKYGVSSNLTLDAAFNPDFGQVEADPAQVNLTAFETYFPEKRPFFIEGKNILSFPVGGISGRESLFYSRRIGRAPQGDPSSAQYSHIPENTTILGAFKLTGKTAQGWSIGLMEALTGREQASLISWEGERKEETVEPLTNYFLGRAEKEFRNGRSAVGMIFTAVHRRIEEESLNFLRKAAYTGGFSFRHRWAKDTYEVSGLFVGSHILGSKEAILQAQQSSTRYYQRPDAPHLELDPDRTSLSGFSTSFSLSKIGGGHWRWSISGMARSPGFEVNDMGYLRYADWISQHIQVSYKEFKPGKIFRDYDISFSLSNDWDYSFTHLDHRERLRFDFRFLNYWSVNLDLSRESEHLKIDHLRGGPAVITPVTWRFGGSFRTDSRKDFFFNVRGNVTASEDGARSYRLSSEFNIRPFSNLHISFSPSFNDGFQRLQYVTELSSEDQDHYILSRIDQTTVSLTLRINYTLAPNLSLQLYSQPFVSAGHYSEFKEVIQPRAKDYADRWHILESNEISLQNGYYHLFLLWTEGKEIFFDDPDFNFRQFRLNLVIRWEYLPGSILFLVWSNGIHNYANVGTLSLRNDLQSLFSSASDNVFLLKISYWFNI
ncbi:MAG: AMIN domain-containing protein [Desulfobacteraceae bacterium]|nr:AMIN domain-containing protein [Desulfobacteraceae bacterium]